MRQLHREFVRAGSDVVEAFTYYGHREKLKVIGKEDILEPLNRQALQIAKEVADESGALLAGDLSNTNAYEPDDSDSVIRRTTGLNSGSSQLRARLRMISSAAVPRRRCRR